MQKAPYSGILHQLHQNYYKISKFAIKNMKFVVKNMKFAIKNMKFSIQNMKFSIQNMKFSIKTMKISIKNMKLSIKNMTFSVYKVCQNSSFVLFITEFSYHMYRKNAVLNGKQKQMKPLQV